MRTNRNQLDEPRWEGLREVLKMAGPAILSNLSFTAMQFVDTVMVGKLGTDQLAAVGSAALWSWVVVSFFVGIVSCVTTFVSQSLGRGEPHNCGSYAWQGIYFALGTIAFAGVLYPLSGPMFESMNHGLEVTRYELDYFRVRVLGLFLIPWQAALAAFFMGINRPMVPMAVAIAGNALNVVLDYCLIFGAAGFPRLEVAGAAWATVASLALQCAVMQAILLSGPVRREYGTARLRFDRIKMRELIVVGWGAGVTWCLDVVTWGVFTSYIVGGAGTVALAAHNSAIQIMHVSFMPAVGLNHAIAPIVGRWIGRGDLERAKARTYTSTRLAMGYMFVMGVIFAVLGGRLLDWAFTDDPDVISLGHWLLIMAAIFQGFDAITIVMSGALRGAGDTRWQAIVMGLAAYLVFLPLAYFLAVSVALGALGAWIGATIYIIGLSGLFFHRFYGEKWRHMKIFTADKDAAHDAPPLAAGEDVSSG